MPRIRANRPSKVADEYTDLHWGIPPIELIEWDDPDYPKRRLPEMGRLVELRIKEPGKRAITKIALPRVQANGSHLICDMKHKNQRLYIFSHPKFAERMQREYGVRVNPRHALTLEQHAAEVGGHHADRTYPKVRGEYIGELRHVIYACPKGTGKDADGYSFYIHEMGEEGGVRPGVVVDAKGRCWLVGGDYYVTTAGINN
jgi:hypothetical protein